MATVIGVLKGYQCGEYLTSSWSNNGLWDESAHLWVLEPLSRIEELPEVGFLQVGRPGVDGIGFGYRSGQDGFWAYYPMERRFELLAPSLAVFVNGWAAGTITV